MTITDSQNVPNEQFFEEPVEPLRLFCDEQRKWRLVNPLSYAVEGQVNISEGNNAVRGTDTISRQNEAWFDSVVVEYTKNLDAEGKAFSIYDAATSGPVIKKTQKKVIDRPYPGPGAAALLLAWYTGRGRTIALRALTDLDTTPGKTLVATMPGTPVQVGIVSSVTWDWRADGNSDEMTVDSRGLIDTPSNAWLFALGAWSAATGTWAAATGTN